MAIKARVLVTIKKDVLDPQGEAIKKIFENSKVLSPKSVRVGKVIDINLFNNHDVDSIANIKKIAKEYLSNPIVEDVDVEVIHEHCHEK